MRYGVVRALIVGVAVVGASGLLGGCGVVSAGPSEVCTDTKEAFRQYISQVESVPAAEPARWRQATEELAGRLDELAGEADGELRKALEAEAKELRAAAAAVGGGDVAQLNAVLTKTPTRIGEACD
ncbi:hypothetical protein ACN3XK_49015 [Actinomadura welshii]